MFENLVESTTNEKAAKKQSIYFGLTTVFYSVLVGAVLVWSVFSFDLTGLNGNSDLTLDSIVAPAMAVESETPQPQIKRETKKDSSKNNANDFDRLKNPVENIKNPTKPPDGITIDKVSIDEIRQGVEFALSTKTERGGGFPGETGRGDNFASSVLEGTKTKPAAEEIDVLPPPVVKKPETARAEKKPIVSTKGVINSIAVKLPKPAYPAAAKAVNASGAVNVQVTIDVQGNVVSAVATSGHPLLKSVAVNAAKQAKFTPTFLSDQPVIVTGVIVYNFVP